MEFTIGDATYAYEVSGEGVQVVLLHGFTGSSATWSTFIAKWKSKFQLITIDLPGHGKTSTETPRTMESFCNDLEKLFDHLQLKDFHLVGYSMGGRTALSFAMRYPQRISSLILESASPGMASFAERDERIMSDAQLAKRIEDEGLEAFIKFWEKIPLFTSQESLPLVVKQAVRNERLAQSEKGLAESLRWMGTGKQPSLWGNLSEFTGPVLLIVGELDQKFVKMNEQMKQGFHAADLIIVENAGHAIHVEQPEIFGRLVAGFISAEI